MPGTRLVDVENNFPQVVVDESIVLFPCPIIPILQGLAGLPYLK
ncbi:MAG: hypothetical protein ACLQVD_08650 [Capsulimonadaceae bacterium]